MFQACSRSHHSVAVPVAVFPLDNVPIVIVTASGCLVPFLLDLATAPPLAHECAVFGCCRGLPAWFVICGVYPPARVRVRVGRPSPSRLVVRPLVVAPPAVRCCICPRTAPCTYSCFAHVHPCAYTCGRCGQCPPGSGIIFGLLFLVFF